MGVLAERMKSQMVLKGLSPRTIDVYLRQVACFVRYVGHGAERVESEEIRGYLHHLLSERQLSQATVSQAYSALRLFYEQILGQTWEEQKIPRARQRRKLPVVLSPAEVEALFAATRNAKYRALFMTIYSGGLRLGEATHLRLEDIDSERMLICVRQGKGNKDRYTLLSKRALAALRAYWRHDRPEGWLFPGLWGERPLCSGTVQKTIRRTVATAGIHKAATAHTLRHSFATHLLDAGVTLYHIQHLLGHRRAETTSVYLHLTHGDLSRIVNPMDQWPALDASAS